VVVGPSALRVVQAALNLGQGHRLDREEIRVHAWVVDHNRDLDGHADVSEASVDDDHVGLALGGLWADVDASVNVDLDLVINDDDDVESVDSAVNANWHNLFAAAWGSASP
jgi:hypothetical protein